jgi:hypothetical protein
MHKRLIAAVVVFSLALAVPAFADEGDRAGGRLRNQLAKIIRVIKNVFVRATLDEPTPPKPGTNPSGG